MPLKSRDDDGVTFASSPVADSSPLARAEAKYEEERLAEKVKAECDAIDRRMDACRAEMIRNGKGDQSVK